MEKFKISIFIFFIFIQLSNCIVVIPFKTIKQFIPSKKKYKTDTPLELWRQNILYTKVSIGTPPQSIVMMIDSESYIVNLFQHFCDVSFSLVNYTGSSSLRTIRPITYFPMVKASVVDETIYFFNNLNLTNLQEYKYFRLIYSDNKPEDQSYLYEYHNNTCINVGLKLKQKTDTEKDINLINQLAMNFKESYDFTVKYTSDDDGMIIIGAEPHVYDHTKYSEKNYRTFDFDESFVQDPDWHLNFSEIYLTYINRTTNNKVKKILNETIKIKIKFDLGIIYGPTDYNNMIKEIFFDDLVANKLCVEVDEDLEKYYYCQKDAEEIIENQFPPLYFKMDKFNETFELNYKDLFREKNGYLYFLVVFSKTHQTFFEIGKIFLKKYTFTFNQNSKYIGYYINSKNPNPSDTTMPEESSEPSSKKDESFVSSKYFYIVLAVSILVVGIIGFVIGKVVYDKIRKRRRNELEDLYEYQPQDDNNNNNNENNNDKNNTNNNNNISEETTEDANLGINEDEGNIN